MFLPLRPSHLRPLLRQSPSLHPPFSPRYASTSPTTPTKSSYLRPSFLALYTLLLTPVAYYTYTSLTSPRRPPHLNPDYFHPYTLVSTTPISTTPIQTSLLTLTTQNASPAPLPNDRVISIEIKQPQLMIARSYTPISVPDTLLQTATHTELDGRTIHLFVKREPGGEMSRYLLSLQPGAEVQIRGPHEEWDISDKATMRNVLFLAGGTGVAPALQAAEKICAKDPEAQVKVIWGVKKGSGETGGVMKEVVETLKERFGGRVKVEVRDDGRGGIGVGEVEKWVRKEGVTCVGLSGPEGFLRFWAGEKRWVDGVEKQGEVGGVLGEVRRRMRREGEREVEVWKM